MIYKPAGSSALTLEQAQRYGERITELIEESNGSIIASQIVEEAKSRDSPLHDWFEWNNKQAADKWRLEQARHMLAFIHVVVKKDEDGGKPVTVRAFQHVHLDDSYTNRTPGVFVTVKRAMTDEELRRQVIGKAHQYLLNWRKKYEIYKEFASVIAAIDDLEL